MFDWREYLELAQTLGNVPASGAVVVRASEAAARSAVSRAYYAAFCHARAHAINQMAFAPAGGASDHGRLAAHFRRRGRVAIASHLNQLRQWRNECDYDNSVANLADKVRYALRDAAAVIQQL